MRFLSLAVVRLRWVVVVFWVCAAVAAYLYLPAPGESNGGLSEVVPQDAPASRASAQAEAQLPGPIEPPAVLVYSDDSGIGGEELERIRADLAYLNGPEGPYRLQRAVPLRVGEGMRALPVLLFFERGTSPTGVGTGVEEIRERLADPPGALEAQVTGAQPVEDETEELINRHLPLVTVATAAVIFVIVGLYYRSPLTPLLPLASIGLAIFLTLRLLTALSMEQGRDLPAQVEPIIVVLLFGVGTDYALFLLSRTRGALAGGADRLGAAASAIQSVGGVLLSSAAVLICAFSLLAFARLGIYTALGPGLAIALTTVFLVTITLVPALMAILGRLWFGRGTVRERAPRVSSVLRRPLLVAGALSLILLVAASGMAGLRVGFDRVGNLPPSAPSAQAYRALEGGFPQGVLAPVNVLVEGGDVASRQAELRRLESGLLGSGGFAAAIGPKDSQSFPGLKFAAEDGSAVRYLLVFYSSPYSAEALDQAGRLQQELPRILDEAGLEEARASVSGQSALSAAARDTSDGDLLRLAPYVLAAVYVILALLLRSVVAPLYLLFATLLSFGATMGVSTMLFQWVLGQDGVVYYVPFALFLLLVALGSDYNIFIMAAVREEARHRPLREAVPLALQRTGSTINAAGLALAASFFLLALIPLQDFFQIGVAMGIGILLDAFVIRPLLVPALALVFGRYGFWPSKAGRPR